MCNEKEDKENAANKPQKSSTATASFQFAKSEVKKYPPGFMDSVPPFNEFVDHIPSRSTQRCVMYLMYRLLLNDYCNY